MIRVNTIDLLTAPLAEELAVMDVLDSVQAQLAGAMAANDDAVIREAINRWLGRDDWTLGEIQGRGVMQHQPNGKTVFCLDGVAIVELYPVTVTNERKGGSTFLRASRQHRLHLPG